MIALSLGAGSAEEAARVVTALGRHRYVAGRLHLVHAFALAAVPDDGGGALAEARAWAREVLAASGVEPASRDERLWRRATEAEIAVLLEIFWGVGARRASAHAALLELLARHELPAPEHEPFDEAAEDAMHPVLVDAGWELIALGRLDPARHAGAIGAFGDPLGYESAVFEEETAIPPVVPLFELPALGAAELLRGAREDGTLVEPLVVWGEGHETYLDYIVRGVRRSSGIPE
jgi:hypothetical protein